MKKIKHAENNKINTLKKDIKWVMGLSKFRLNEAVTQKRLISLWPNIGL